MAGRAILEAWTGLRPRDDGAGVADDLGGHGVAGGEAGGLGLAAQQRREIGAVEAVAGGGGVDDPGGRRESRAGRGSPPRGSGPSGAALQRAAADAGGGEAGEDGGLAALAEERHLVVEGGQADVGQRPEGGDLAAGGGGVGPEAGAVVGVEGDPAAAAAVAVEEGGEGGAGLGGEDGEGDAGEVDEVEAVEAARGLPRRAAGRGCGRRRCRASR